MRKLGSGREKSKEYVMLFKGGSALVETAASFLMMSKGLLTQDGVQRKTKMDLQDGFWTGLRRVQQLIEGPVVAKVVIKSHNILEQRVMKLGRMQEITRQELVRKN